MKDFYKIGWDTAASEHHKIKYSVNEKELYKLLLWLHGVRMFCDKNEFFWKGVCAYFKMVDEVSNV